MEGVFLDMEDLNLEVSRRKPFINVVKWNPKTWRFGSDDREDFPVQFL